MRRYTVNFNPAIEERLRAGVERETPLAAGSAEGEPVRGPA